MEGSETWVPRNTCFKVTAQDVLTDEGWFTVPLVWSVNILKVWCVVPWVLQGQNYVPNNTMCLFALTGDSNGVGC